MTGAWFDGSAPLDYCFDCAEIRRLQRTQEDANELQRRLARQRVRFILNRLVRR